MYRMNHLKIKSLKLEVRLQLNIEHTRVDLFAFGHKVGLITHCIGIALKVLLLRIRMEKCFR